MIKNTPDNNYITEGPTTRAFIRFSIPLILTSLLMQSYTIIDALILGNWVSEEALGAVNTIATIIDLMILIQYSLSAGCSVCISHLAGAGKSQRIRCTIDQMRVVIISISLLLAVLGFFFSDDLLALIHTPTKLHTPADIYLKIVCFGIPFSSIYQLHSAILRGLGDSRKPLGGMLISTCTNLGLDLILVIVFRQGIAGAAAATVTAQIIACIYLQLRLRHKLYHYDPEEFPLGIRWKDQLSRVLHMNDRQDLRESILLSLPKIPESICSNLGNVLLQNLTNLLGSFVVIGVTVSYRIDSIVIVPMVTLSMAISVFTGQNIGAGRPDRVRDAFRTAIILCLSISAVMTLILGLYNIPMIRWFGISDQSLYYAHQYVMICLPVYWVFSLQFIFNGFLQGSKHPYIASGISIAALFVRVTFAYGFVDLMGSAVLPTAELTGWLVQAVFGGILAIRILRKLQPRDT